MKISIAIFLLIASSQLAESGAVNLGRAGFIDCEATGSCAPAAPRKGPAGFSANVAYADMYSSTELDNAAEEVREAKKQMVKKKLEDEKKKA